MMQPQTQAPRYQDGESRTVQGVPYVRQGGRWVRQGGAAPAMPAPAMPAPVTVGAPQPLRQREAELSVVNQESTIAARQQGMQTEAQRQEMLRLQTEAQRVQNQRQDQGQQLPQNSANALSLLADSARSLARAREGFVPEYAGNTITGDLENSLQYMNSDWGTPGQRDWWAEFRRTDIGERNEIFGAALTPHEQAAWDQTTVTPRGDPREVAANVTRRYEIALNAARRQRDYLIANGYRPEAVNALLGPDVIALIDGQQAPNQSGQSAPNAAAATSGAPAATSGLPPSISDRSTPVMGSGGGSGQASVNQGGVETVRDPALAGINRRIGQLMVRGTPDDRIREYLASVGANPDPAALEAAFAFRRSPAFREWRRQNPNAPYPVELEMRDQPVSQTRQFLADQADTPVGAYVASTANMLAGQRLDQVAGAVTGANPEVVRAGLDEVRERNPVSSLIGDTTGALGLYAGGSAALARLGVGGAGTGAFAGRQVAIDSGIGAYQGQGIDRENPVLGALLGAGTAATVGVGARGALNTVGRAVSPTGGSARPLYDEGVTGQTIGQRFANSGPMGRAWNKVEEISADVPILGPATAGAAREGARREFQRGAYNQALREIGTELPAGVQTGPRANAFMQRAFNQEFRAIRGSASFRPDGDFATAFGRIQQQVRELADPDIQMFERTIRANVGNPIARNNGQLTGDQYIRAASRINARAQQLEKQGNVALASAFREFADEMDNAAMRANPGLAPRLQAARAGYARSVIIENAARRRGGEVGEFNPTQFDAAVQDSSGLRSRQYLRGEAPMQEYATAGRALGETTPNSGTNMRQMATGGGAAFGPAGLAAMGYISAEMAALLSTPAGLAMLTNFPLVRQAIQAGINPNRGAVSPALREELEMLAPMLGSALGATAAGGAVTAQ